MFFKFSSLAANKHVEFVLTALTFFLSTLCGLCCLLMVRQKKTDGMGEKRWKRSDKYLGNTLKTAISTVL